MNGHDEEKNNLVFHYSRENRLKSAPETVRQLNSQTPFRRPNLFRTLTANKASAFLFLAIIMLSLTTLVTTFLLPTGNTGALAGNKLRISALRFQGTTYLALKKTAQPDAYVGVVELRVQALATDGRLPKGDPLSALSVNFSPKSQEEFRLAIPGEQEALQVVLQTASDRVTLQTRVE